MPLRQPLTRYLVATVRMDRPVAHVAPGSLRTWETQGRSSLAGGGVLCSSRASLRECLIADAKGRSLRMEMSPRQMRHKPQVSSIMLKTMLILHSSVGGGASVAKAQALSGECTSRHSSDSRRAIRRNPMI